MITPDNIKIMLMILTLVFPLVGWSWRISARVSKLELKQDMILSNLEHLPNAMNFSDLRLSIEELNGNIKQLTTSSKATSKRIDGVEQSIERVENYLLNNKDK